MINWEFEAYPVTGDLNLVLIIALMFPIVRFLLDRLLLERMGKLLLLGPSEGLNQREQKKWKKRHGKFKESAWKCLYFLSAELFELAVLYKESWFTDTQKFWVGPGDQVWPDQKVKMKLKISYMYAAGFFTYSFFAAFFWETRRSDFLVTTIHHVATVVLITLSYMLSYEVLLTLDKRRYRNGPIYYYVFNTLLICLFILNIYWWILIYRVLVKQIRSKGKVGEDVRSDSEEEDEKED